MSSLEEIFTEADKRELASAEVLALFDRAYFNFSGKEFGRVEDDMSRIAGECSAKERLELFDMPALREAITELNVMEALNELDALVKETELVEGILRSWTREPLLVFATSMTLTGEKLTSELVVIPGKLMTVYVRDSLFNWDQKLNVQDDGQPEFRIGYKEPHAVMHRAEKQDSGLYKVNEETIFDIPISRIVGVYKQ